MYEYYESLQEYDWGWDGICLDSVITSECLVEEMNTTYRIELSLVAPNKLSSLVKEGGYIAATIDGVKTLFKCLRPYPKEDRIDIKCDHLFFTNMDGHYILDTNIVNQTGAQALPYILNHVTDRTNIRMTGTSDIDTVNSARLEMKNLVSEAILGSNENSFVKRWGGELKIVGNTFTMNKRRGSDKSVFTFMYGRDIAGIDGYIDYAVTLGIDPRGYNNLRLDNNEIIYSPRKAAFEALGEPIYTKNITYSDIAYCSPNDTNQVEGAYTDLAAAKAALKARAQKEFTENQIDQPILALTVDVDTYAVNSVVPELFKSMKFEVGDTVSVSLPNLNIEATTRIQGIRRSLLMDKILSISLGELKQGPLNDINKNLGIIETSIEDASKNIEYTVASNVSNEVLNNIVSCNKATIVAACRNILYTD